MPTNQGRRRIYSFNFINPIPPSCDLFQKYLKDQISGGRALLNFSGDPTGEGCVVGMEIECWSTKRNNAANFLCDVEITFPRVRIKNFRRRRYSKLERLQRRKNRNK